MKVAVVIPTYKRIEKLTMCLKSLEKQTHKNFEVVIFCDNNDASTADYLKDNYKYHNETEYNITWIINDKQEFAPGSWNKAFKQLHDKYDAFLWLVDDAELYSNALEEAVKCMQENFPDNDGIIGIHQVCEGHPEYTFKYFGQVLISNKFVERYKDVDYRVCCPYYNFLYQDEELYYFAKSLDKFKECSSAILNHKHPAFTKDFDDTHYLSRTNVIRNKDKETYERRRKENKVWGDSWEE